MTIEIINHTERPAKIENFSTDRYVDPDYMDQEWTNVWCRSWLLAGLESDVRQPGDFFVFEIGREQILVTRTTSGLVQGFFNVCQHRGNRLVTEERGHARNFRCAYHAWTYDNEGTLKGVPYENRFASGVPREERSLCKVHTEVWNGFVFVSMAEKPQALLDFLGPLVDRLAPYNFREMVLVQDQTVHHQCNWKAVVDNFSELYHVDFLHPQHKRMVDCCNDTVHLFPNGHTGLAVPGATVSPRFPIPEEPTDIQSAQLASLGLDPADFNGRVLDVREAVQKRKREVGKDLGFDYSAFADEQLSDVWQYNLFPNTILSFTPERCWVLRPRPHPTDPQQCYFDKLSLQRFADPKVRKKGSAIVGSGSSSLQTAAERPEDQVRPERDVFGHEAIVTGEKTMTDTIDQDIGLLAGVQAGMSSAGFNTVWLNDDEMRVQHFHNELDQLMQSSQDS
jgi:phenylpropionate dioxygenase-like ring-hydroxylating dioxygenase large terminal subunit